MPYFVSLPSQIQYVVDASVHHHTPVVLQTTAWRLACGTSLLEGIHSTRALAEKMLEVVELRTYWKKSPFLFFSEFFNVQ